MRTTAPFPVGIIEDCVQSVEDQYAITIPGLVLLILWIPPNSTSSQRLNYGWDVSFYHCTIQTVLDSSKVGKLSNVRFRLEGSSSSYFRLLDGSRASKAGMMHICARSDERKVEATLKWKMELSRSRVCYRTRPCPAHLL